MSGGMGNDLPVVTTTLERISDLRRIRSRHHGKSAEAQMQRMLDAMSLAGVTVPEAREHLLVSNPLQCVHRLRRVSGVEVAREEVRYVDEDGELRDTVRYVLLDD